MEKCAAKIRLPVRGATNAPRASYMFVNFCTWADMLTGLSSSIANLPHRADLYDDPKQEHDSRPSGDRDV